MTNYYELRRAAIADIDTLFADGKSKETIEYLISQRHGFGRKIVSERIDQINKLVAKIEENEAKKLPISSENASNFLQIMSKKTKKGGN
jgi:hypothetical protein